LLINLGSEIINALIKRFILQKAGGNEIYCHFHEKLLFSFFTEQKIRDREVKTLAESHKREEQTAEGGENGYSAE
jgi:hypothetical protein